VTVWVVSADRQTIARAAQGHLMPDGSFDVVSNQFNVLVHFSGQISADRQTAQINADRPGVLSFTVTAPRVLDVNPTALPNPLVGTFNGSVVASDDGARLQVRLSIDPGGNSTFEAEAIPPGSISVRLHFAHFYVTPSPP